LTKSLCRDGKRARKESSWPAISLRLLTSGGGPAGEWEGRGKKGELLRLSETNKGNIKPGGKITNHLRGCEPQREKIFTGLRLRFFREEENV